MYGVKKLVRSRALDEWIPDLERTPLRPIQRPLSPIEESQLATQVTEWLALGVIEKRPTQPINNNLVFVAKKNGSIRVCDDCTPVNLVTKDYDWPLPRIQDVWRKLNGARYFTRLDLKNAFFRIKIPPRYRHYTSFTLRGQQYQFRKMPFGLKTAPAIFQQFMDTHLSLFANWATWFIDDILIQADTLPELRKRTNRMKARLGKIGCLVNEEKSEYEKTSLLFVGVWVFTTGTGPNIFKLQEAVQLEPPSNKKTMQSALGLVSYLKDFIPLVSHFTSELYPTKEGLRLPPDEVREHWKRLIQHIRSAANTLRHWRDGVAADLYTDASGTALGVVVLQNGRIVAVSSRKLTGAESRYSATDREHLGLVHAAKKFRLLLHQSDSAVRVHTDHMSLLDRKAAEMTPRQTRWLTTINQWIPRVQHVPGIKNPADFFSRWPVEIKGGAIKV